MSSEGIQLEVCPINEKGEFTAEVADFNGKYVKEADKEIVKHLKIVTFYTSKALLFTPTQCAQGLILL